MKILYTHLYDSRYEMGGADRGVLDLALAIKEKYGAEIMFAVNRGSLSRELLKRQIPIQEIPGHKFGTLKLVMILKKTLESFQPDLMHSHHRYTTFLLSLFFKDRGVPILHTQRILSHDKRGLFRYGHFVTTVSESVRENLIYDYHVPQDKVMTIMNAVTLSPSDEHALSHLKKRYPRQNGELFVLCAGRFDEQKGHRYLVEAVAGLPPALQKRIKIFLAGEGPLEASLREGIKQKGIENCFIFLGYSTEIAELLNYCDFLILPSLWEGLPRSVLEAFAAGRAVIATDIPGTREVMENGKNGLLVPPRSAEKLREAIHFIFEHPEDVKRMGGEAWKASRQYSFDAMVAKYHDLYERLILGRSG